MPGFARRFQPTKPRHPPGDLADRLGDLVQQVLHRRLVTLHGGNRSVGVRLRVDELPVESIAGVCAQLSKEGALGTPVSVAKRMQGIDVTEVVGQSGDEAVPGEAAEPILSASSPKISAP